MRYEDGIDRLRKAIDEEEFENIVLPMLTSLEGPNFSFFLESVDDGYRTKLYVTDGDEGLWIFNAGSSSVTVDAYTNYIGEDSTYNMLMVLSEALAEFADHLQFEDEFNEKQE